MIAIQTRFIGPTNRRGARIVAETMEGGSWGLKPRRAYVNWEHAMESEDNHRAAAVKLINRLGWTANGYYADWYCGGTERGYVFVCALDYAKVETAAPKTEVV